MARKPYELRKRYDKHHDDESLGDTIDRETKAAMERGQGRATPVRKHKPLKGQGDLPLDAGQHGGAT